MSHSDPIENLSAEEQRALLARLLREQAGGLKFYPLSYAQQRMWFLWRLAPDSPAYHIAGGARLRGPLDAAALARSLAEVVRRHESLRTTFAERGGRPAQVISEGAAARLEVEDLSGRGAGEREAEALRLAREEAQRPFDLAAGPLLRAKLLRLSDEDHVLLVTMHHIISDGWSIGVLLGELTRLYAAFASGRESPLEELPVQYADYAAWQRRHLEGGGELTRQLAYWRERLAGAPALELPTDRPRGESRGHGGGRVALRLGAGLSAGVREAARREGVTPFMLLLAAFQVLLRRYTGQEDISVGTPVAGRNRSEVEGLIGFFVNTLVLRTDLSGDPSFQELLARVRETAVGAYAHQDVPFEKLVEELEVERSLARTPLFQVMIALRADELSSFKLPGLAVMPLNLPNDTAQFDLTLSFLESPDELRGAVEYNTELFDRETVERLADHYARLLAAAVSDMTRRVSDLPLLDAAELEQQLHVWNDTRRVHRPLCVHQLVEEQAARTPDAVALAEPGAQLTYAELDRRADALARRLRAAGVRAETRVGLLAGRSAGAVAAMLAVLKAGGAYLPLDPAYPRERLERMLEDAGARVLVAERGLRELLPDYAGASVYLEEVGGSEDEGEGASRPPDAVEPAQLAYIMYTSGSKGAPKGVMISHASLSDRIQTLAADYRLGANDRMLQFVSLSFDASAEEIFPVLVSGATLVFNGDPTKLSPAEFLPQCERLGVTHLHLPAAYWHEVAEKLSASGRPVPGWLRLLIVGGDSVQPASLANWLRATAHPSRFVNAYGPTETTITATLHEVTTEPEAVGRLSRLPIGRPVANTRAYILDGRSNPVPVGVRGELCIGGEGLARGYLGRPALTAERFVPDPFSGEAGARLYRTGDVCRWLPDGNIEFVGRADNQVKVRGYRIELGEVEAALTQHDGVREAVVVARGEGAARRLVAYVVAEAGGGGTPGGAELRSHLRGRLPEYMIPAAFVALERLPLTANGKVDRRALPAPDPSAGGGVGRGYVAPRGETERAIAAVWREALGAERVGAHDNFFDLGGHSLLLAQVHARLREGFARPLTMLDMFQYPTVAALARHVDQGDDAAGPSADKSQERLKKQKRAISQQKAIQDRRKIMAVAARTSAANQVGRTARPGASADDPQVAGENTKTAAAGDEAQAVPKPTTGEVKEHMVRFYDSINSELDSSALGRYASFLNFGYIPNENRRYSRITLPQNYLNKNATNLVLEVVGDCDLGGRDVLDVGCGRGGTVATINKYFGARRLVGVDISPNAIRFCGEQFPGGQIEFLVGDAENLPFADESFDVVVNVESSSSYPNLQIFYTEVFRVLRRGGHFLYTDLLPSDTVTKGLAFLESLGFVIERNRDITSNVLLSCDEAAARHLHTFKESQRTETIKTFLAVPGSRPYNEMQSGESKYFIVKAVKP